MPINIDVGTTESVDSMRPKYEHKLEQAIARLYNAKLMSNTKWRKVFASLAERKIFFQVAWVTSPDAIQDTLYVVRKSLIGEYGLIDPGIGGPCLYKEIAYIRVPKVRRVVRTMSGNIYGYQEHEQDLSGLMEELKRLGSLPLVQKDEFIEIVAYRNQGM